ncbi:MAG: protein kinase [Planctomycetota bacterium]
MMIPDADFESLIAEFEREFDQQRQPSIDSYVKQYRGDRSDIELELIHTELELRLKRGDAARVETYLDRFPELAEQPDVVSGLIRAEFRVRSRYETAISLREYVLRFPDHYNVLLNETANEKENSVGIETLIERISDNESASFSDEASRFRRKQLHRQGGLGNVWIAQDQEFDRTVALKEIKDKFANDPENQARFVNEAILTASLEHPGIVPVYGMGRFQNGRPYYAMKLVRGESMQKAIAAFHNNEPATSRLAFQRLLKNFLSLCQTIQFAHENGVLHRDIKPANVMVGQLGETLVVDWGLATVVQTDKFPAAKRLVVERGADNGLIGSPAFMSPEQANGNRDRVCFQSDIYSLGATLLCLVTGETNPNSTFGKTDLTSDNQTNHGMLLSTIYDRVPKAWRPLVSVCSKAMMGDPLERYPTASDLAEDIERFLADEPIDVHPDTWSESTSRLIRKNRGLVVTMIVASLVLALLSTTAAILINDALNSEKTAHAESEVARQAAVRSSEAAELARLETAAVLEDTKLGFDVFAGLFSGPGACGLGKDLTLSEGLESLKKQNRDQMPPRLQAMLHNVYALNHHGAMRPDKAILEYDQAIELSDKHYGKNSPLSVECQTGKAVVLQQTGQLEAAKQLIDPLLKLCDANPEANRHAKYHLLSVLAIVELESQNLTAAEASLANATKSVKQVYADEAEAHRLKIEAIRVALLRKQGRFQEAESLCDHLLELTEESGQSRSSIGVRLLTEKARTQLQHSLMDDELLNLKSILATIQKAKAVHCELFGDEHLNSRLLDFDLACALYRHPQATKPELTQATRLLRQLGSFLKQSFPDAKDLRLKVEYHYWKSIDAGG